MESTVCNQDEGSQTLWEATPENIQVIRRFPKPHDDLFKLAESVPFWWQLATSAPVLAFMVARCWYFDSMPSIEYTERVRKYVLLKRTSICSALGFPSSHRMLRLLSKFEINAEESTPLMIIDLMIMRLLLIHEPYAFEILEQPDQIGTCDICSLATGLNFSRSPRGNELGRGLFLLTLPFCEWFFQLPASKRHWLSHSFINGELTASYVDVVRVLLGEVPPLTHFRNSRKAAAYIHDYLRKTKAIRGTRFDINYGIIVWPEPPIEAPNDIIPLLSYKELQVESDEMHHCIETYSDKILLGIYYAYRMEEPCRCTIGIKFDDGAWKLDQVRGINNLKITDPEIITRLEEFISGSNSSKVSCAPRLDYLNAISKACGLPLRKFSDE